MQNYIYFRCKITKKQADPCRTVAATSELARFFITIEVRYKTGGFLLLIYQPPDIAMFASSTKDKKTTNPALANTIGNDKDATTVIAKGTVLEGKFACTENVRLDGSIHGEVKVDKRLVMGDSSFVQGNIVARDAAIQGRIKGDLVVNGALHLMESAVIEGNISARTMVVDEGARYNGTCKIGEPATSAKN